MSYINEGVGAAEIFNIILKFAKTKQQAKTNSDKGYGKSLGEKDAPGLNRSSIMKATKDLVLSFPVLCTNNITPETASMIQKAIERNCVTTLQLLFTSANMTGENGIEVLKMWHKNMDNDVTMDDYFDFIDSLQITNDNHAKGMFESAAIREQMIKECKENNKYYPQSSFAETTIDQFEISMKKNGDYIVEGKSKNKNNETLDQFKAYINKTAEEVINKKNADYDKLSSKNKDKVNKAFELKMANADKYGQVSNELDKSQKDLQKAKDEINQLTSDTTLTQGQYYKQSIAQGAKKNELEAEKNQLAQKQYDHNVQKDAREYFHKMLLDTDVKKCNELVPTMMIVNYNAIIDDTSLAIKNTSRSKNSPIAYPEKSFIAGVKARLIGIDSLEVIDRVRMVFDNKVTITNLIRATTGEISFCRDFIAGIDQAKIEAERNSRLSKTSPIWRSLQNRANKSNYKRISRRTNDAGAITTLVMNQEEVTWLREKYKIDMSNIKTAKQLMEFYNLMGVAIVNENNETVRFLFDGDTYYQDYSFNALERETGDSSYKKVVNLLSQVNRG